MRIPDGPSGVPTLSATQFRMYGAGGHQLDEQEDDAGCPRRYFRRYVSDEPYPKEKKSYPLLYGSMIHQVLYAMEADGMDPDEALEQHFDPTLPPEAMAEARRDLARYVDRGSTPRDLYATLAVEQDLDAVLMVDDEGQEIRFRGIIDWIGVDLDDPSTLHVVDYKTNRSPISAASLAGDVQMRAYHWLVRQNATKFGLRPERVNIVVHLDGVKFHEVSVRYTDDQIEDWRMWARAVARAIMQDDEHRPVLNTYCSTCPVRHDCPAYQALPEAGADMLARRPPEGYDEARQDWRERANKMRLMLDKAVKALDAEYLARAQTEGGLAVGRWVWTRQPNWKTVYDLRALHAALGDEFYDIAGVTKTAVEKAESAAPPGVAAQIRQATSTVADGLKWTRREEKK